MGHARTTRVLLVDDDGRVLLLRTAQPGGGHVWTTPGGDVGADEGPAAAAVRHLREQASVVDVEVVPLPGDLPGGAQEHVFAARSPRGAIAAGLTDWEVEHHRGHRWWSAADLRYTSETVVPAGLAGLLDDALGGRASSGG
ncbi:NUDIX domain-containing protein [Kineococcus sp. GCM10028916]|uniref:NUDIX domain-containing protein n=1 Tax=Kineococcus sp. GCM10028916 TaxID=3273394 RepID=UPI0036334D1F